MPFVTSPDGARIAYDRSGHGPTVVLVNGALSTRDAADALLPLVDPHLTLIAYDRRGRGDSTDTLPYAVEREIEDLAAVMALADGPVGVYGHSSGGVLALEAAMRGLPIARLAVHEPPYILPGTRPMPAADIVDRLAALVAADDREGALTLFLTEHVGMPEATVDSMRASPAWTGMLAMAHTVPYDARIVGLGELPAGRLSALTIQTLVLIGTATFPFLRESAEALVTALPRGERRILEGQHHGASAESIAPELIRFFG